MSDYKLVPLEPTAEMIEAACDEEQRPLPMWSRMKAIYTAMIAAAPAVQGEPVEFDYPEFHEQGMGCGLEDRGITDRYEAMRYGWDEALDRVAEIIDDIGPLYTAPQPAEQQPAPDVAELVEALESAIKAFEEIQGGCATDRDICREEAAKIRAALAGKGGAQ